MAEASGPFGSGASLAGPDNLLSGGAGLIDEIDYEGRAQKIGKTEAESGKWDKEGNWKTGIRRVGHGAKRLAKSAGIGGMMAEIDSIMGKKPAKSEKAAKPKKAKPKKVKAAKAAPTTAKAAKTARRGAKGSLSRSNTGIITAAKEGLKELEDSLDSAFKKGKEALLRDIGKIRLKPCDK